MVLLLLILCVALGWFLVALVMKRREQIEVLTREAKSRFIAPEERILHAVPGCWRTGKFSLEAGTFSDWKFSDYGEQGLLIATTYRLVFCHWARDRGYLEEVYSYAEDVNKVTMVGTEIEFLWRDCCPQGFESCAMTRWTVGDRMRQKRVRVACAAIAERARDARPGRPRLRMMN